jgi:hypothetical protein
MLTFPAEELRWFLLQIEESLSLIKSNARCIKKILMFKVMSNFCNKSLTSVVPAPAVFVFLAAAAEGCAS